MHPLHVRERALRLVEEGRSLNSVAHELGVSRAAIRDWRDRGAATLVAPCCPRCNGAALDEAAYAELFGWYLGDGWLETHRRGVQALHLYNDARYPDLNARLLELIRRVKPGARPHTQWKPGCVVTTATWKHWTCLFPQHGPGRKHERHLALEDWQRVVVTEHPGAFVRGLFHSDGCRVDNWATQRVAGRVKRYEYGRWQFVNHSADIQRFCTDALDLLQVPWRQSSRTTISVSRRDAVARLDEIVGRKS